MVIPLNRSTDPAAKAAIERLDQLKKQLDLTPSSMSLQAPKDMAAERDAAKFDIEKLSYYWAGGEERYKHLQRAFKFMASDPELVMQPPRNILDTTRPEIREFTMGQIHRYVKVLQDPLYKNDPDFKEALFQALAMYSESFSMRIGVHTALFKNVLNMLGSDAQREQWLDDIENFRVIGCFAMTELGHSSALRDIETRATYDMATDEFVIESPSITATKWWIGMAGKTATHTMVIAQTYINGKHYGHNWFVVQLRDRETGELMPNIVAGDIGAKVGRSGLDNGWIQFRNVRTPRANMMSRWVSLTRQGEYTPAPSPVVMYATLIPERIMLTVNCVAMVTQALTIATRYGVVRRQGHKNEQIMDYLSHYGKLVPAIAFMYMTHSACMTVNEQFKVLTAGGDMDPMTYLNHVGDMHAISACFKGYVGWFGSDILETCRRCCGGHAYSAYNAIGSLIDDWGVLTTGGGDNVVMLQQTTRILLHRLEQKLEMDEYPELQFKSSTHYFTRAKEYVSWSTWNVKDVEDCLKNLTLIEDALHCILVKRLNSINNELKAGSTHNDLLLDEARAAELHGAAYMFSDAVSKFGSLNHVDPGLDKDVAKIMHRLTALWGLHVLHTFSDQGYKEGVLSPAQIKATEKLYLKLCKELRYQVVGLTDAFGYPDFVLKAPIGKYDGDIYEPYFETVLNAPSSTGKPPYHAKYIQPLTTQTRN